MGHKSHSSVRPADRLALAAGGFFLRTVNRKRSYQEGARKLNTKKELKIDNGDLRQLRKSDGRSGNSARLNRHSEVGLVLDITGCVFQGSTKLSISRRTLVQTKV